MNILPLSDLHLEFLWNYPTREISKILRPTTNYLKVRQDITAVVLAGDISSNLETAKGQEILEHCLKSLLSHVKYVIYVSGNHEYYNSSIKWVDEYLSLLDEKTDNLHILQQDMTVIDGVRFIGAPLWFIHEKLNVLHWRGMNDSRQIEDPLRDLERLGRLQALYLVDALRSSPEENNIVVSHFLPSSKSTPYRFRNSTLNRFFVNPLPFQLIDKTNELENKRMTWIHGHTHDSSDYVYHFNPRKGIRVVCNPLGYPGIEENPEFRPDLVVNI